MFNKKLHTLFNNVDKVVFKEDGVYNNKCLSENVVLTITNPEDIQTLKYHLEFDEEQSLFGGVCMCSGDYGVELYTKERVIATLGFHHGISIRYYLWKSDGILKRGNELLQFLAHLGLEEPLQKEEEQHERIARDNSEEGRWLQKAPKCFTTYIEDINQLKLQDDLSPLIKDLEKEILNKNDQIIALLRLYGVTNNYWSGYPIYEEVPFNILLTHYTFQEIIDAYVNANRNMNNRRGLARFVCTFRFIKQWKKHKRLFTDFIINDIENQFRTNVDTTGLARVRKLKALFAK